MQNYSFKATDDALSFTVTSYSGDEENVVIPEEYCSKPVTILYDKLFAGHDEITSIQFPDTITDLGELVFDGCTGLKHLELPASLMYLWGQTFVRCGIEEIILPDGIRTIPPKAFKDCRNLRKVVCGAGMRKIYGGAFNGCTQLTELICGADVEISANAEIAPDAVIRR
ncbi:MAG: leucine-rich repeat domain-containing protein [Eubacteriales bacterium]|nr:leucine-rich repeat domain-containing protein [Eubacteriales bacterium]